MRGLPLTSRLLEQLPNLFIARLREIVIPDTYSAKRMRRSGTDNLVDFFTEFIAGLMRSNGHGYQDASGALWTQSSTGSQHRGSRGKSVVYQHHGSVLYRRRRPAIAIE